MFTHIDFSKKNIILLLIAILVILVVVVYGIGFFRTQNSTVLNPNNNPLVENLESFPTGVIINKNSVDSDQLDIIGVSPSDLSTNISLDSKIVIDFSKEFNLEEIELFISPDLVSKKEIVKNSLIISPLENLKEGTTYTVSVNLKYNLEKVRLYKFTTQGNKQEALADTRNEKAIESFKIEERKESPDIYVANNTPYETESFKAVSEYNPVVPSGYYLIITSKISNQQEVRNSVNVWLQSLLLTADQINSLDIRYTQ